MKRTSSSKNSVPRLNSLLYRLQHPPGPEEQPYLDQLMFFLDDPPPGIRDRWKEGAAMCAALGITCSGSSVWRLYRSYAVEWRARLALQTGNAHGEAPGAPGKKVAPIIALRTGQQAPAVIPWMRRIRLIRLFFSGAP